MWQAPKQHVIVEFSFDVTQAARGRYSFTYIRSMLDFQVATALRERAFHDTYGLEMDDVLGDQERAISTYRYAVSQLIPALTEAAWRDKRDEILAQTPDATRETRRVRLPAGRLRARPTGRDYQKPARFARFLAWVYRLVPKIGPLKPLAFKAPTPDVDRLFEDSVARSHARFQALLRQVRSGGLDLAEHQLRHRRAGARAPTTSPPTRLTPSGSTSSPSDDFAGATPQVRSTLGAFYRNAPPPDPRDRKARKAWERVQAALARLDSAPSQTAQRRH